MSFVSSHKTRPIKVFIESTLWSCERSRKLTCGAKITAVSKLYKKRPSLSHLCYPFPFSPHSSYLKGSRSPRPPRER